MGPSSVWSNLNFSAEQNITDVFKFLPSFSPPPQAETLQVSAVLKNRNPGCSEDLLKDLGNSDKQQLRDNSVLGLHHGPKIHWSFHW